MTVSFDPELPKRFTSLRAYLSHRTPLLNKSAKTIAADMDISPSTLSRKLNPSEGDTQRFNLDDLELYIGSTDEAMAVIQYLAAKFVDTDEARQRRALANIERLQGELAGALDVIKDIAKQQQEAIDLARREELLRDEVRRDEARRSGIKAVG